LELMMAEVKPGTLTLSITQLTDKQVAHLKKLLWEMSAKPDGQDGCWLPHAYAMANGYKTVSWGSVKRLAHRASYALEHWEAPGDRLVCHTCDNRGCANPAHLFLDSAKGNSQDMVQKGRVGNKRHITRRLTADQVAVLKWRYQNGESALSLARELGISDRTLNSAFNGHSWNWVEPRAPEDFAQPASNDDAEAKAAS
jgi:hypothetical protein